MNRLRAKLTSQSGASITFALLLFLVCAVVSAIVLAAGTAASGRMSGSVKNDQRYYSVTSACEMLIGLFDGAEVKTVKTQDGESTTVSQTVTKGTTSVTSADAENKYKLLTLAARLYTGTNSSTESFPSSLVVKLGSDQNASITATFDQTNSGRITLAVSSYDSTDTDNVYTLYLIFDANIKEIEDSKTKDTASGSSTTISTTTDMTWTLTSMSTTAP